MIAWFEKHIDLAFNINAILVFVLVVFSLYGFFQMFGWSNNSMLDWTSYQWHMFNFLYLPTFEIYFLLLLFGMLGLLKWYISFVLVSLQIFFYLLDNALANIIQIINNGFVYPGNNVWGILVVLLLFFNLIGSTFWFKKFPLYYREFSSRLSRQ